MLNDDEFLELDDSHSINVFCGCFYDELESWFSADIICCTNCFNDFKEKWPGIYSRDLDFQCNTIGVNEFYSGSRINWFYSKEQYDYLLKYIKCPRCDSPITDLIYPYNFPFDWDITFEEDIEEIEDMAKNTPFLLLSHPLAKRTFDTILQMSKQKHVTKIRQTYFRARVYEENDGNGNRKIYNESDFTPPPKEKVREGRYNHAGHPVLYLGDTPDTCFSELRKPEEGIMYAEIEISESIKVLDLLESDDQDDNIINMIKWSSIIQSPKEGEGWDNPHYTFTRFIADCALFAGFHAIKYPSVRLHKGHNLVILDTTTVYKNIQISNIRKFIN